MATKTDILRHAFRRIAVVASDEALTADQADYAGDTLDLLVPELAYSHGVTVSATAPSDGYVLPLAYLLAVEIAPHYLVAPPEPRSRAIMRLRAALLSDDRPDSRDADKDGTVSDGEAEAGKRAAFY